MIIFPDIFVFEECCPVDKKHLRASKKPLQFEGKKKQTNQDHLDYKLAKASKDMALDPNKKQNLKKKLNVMSVDEIFLLAGWTATKKPENKNNPTNSKAMDNKNLSNQWKSHTTDNSSTSNAYSAQKSNGMFYQNQGLSYEQGRRPFFSPNYMKSSVFAAAAEEQSETASALGKYATADTDMLDHLQPARNGPKSNGLQHNKLIAPAAKTQNPEFGSDLFYQNSKSNIFFCDNKEEEEEETGMGEEEGEGEIPSSLNQIYKLSKKNRKRNKQKKKLKEDSVKDSSPAYSTANNNQNTAQQSQEDLKNFMKKIGWVQ